MPLELHLCTEADMPDFQRIAVAAFNSGSGMTTLIKPAALPADYMEKSLNKHLKSFREDRDCTYVKVIDTDLGGKMIAGAKWRFNEKERDEEVVRKTLPEPGVDEEGRPAAQDFYRYLARVRWEYMGTKPFSGMLSHAKAELFLYANNDSFAHLGHGSGAPQAGRGSNVDSMGYCES
jgi:hypothetical protein